MWRRTLSSLCPLLPSGRPSQPSPQTVGGRGIEVVAECLETCFSGILVKILERLTHPHTLPLHLQLHEFGVVVFEVGVVDLAHGVQVLRPHLQSYFSAVGHQELIEVPEQVHSSM